MISNLSLLIAHVQVAHNLASHVITGDLKIINNTSMRDVFVIGSKYREPKAINWNITLKI